MDVGSVDPGVISPEVTYGDWSYGRFLFDSGAVLLTQLLFFGMGWLFFMRKLFRDYEVCGYPRSFMFRAAWRVAFGRCTGIYANTSHIEIFSLSFALVSTCAGPPGFRPAALLRSVCAVMHNV